MDPLLEAMLSLIKHYVGRQEVVYQAMRDLRPKYVNLDTNKLSNKEFYDVFGLYFGWPQRGYWGKNQEWEHFIHGSGFECKLTYTITKEPIECGVYDVKRFDKYWFRNHLIWRIEQEPNHPDILILATGFQAQTKPFEDFVIDLIHALADHGKLTPIPWSPEHPADQFILKAQ